jgi:hypothetical protein
MTANFQLFTCHVTFRLFRQKRMSGLDRSAGTGFENEDCVRCTASHTSPSFPSAQSSNFLQIAGTEILAVCRKSGNITHTPHSSQKQLITTLLRHVGSGRTGISRKGSSADEFTLVPLSSAAAAEGRASRSARSR